MKVDDKQIIFDRIIRWNLNIEKILQVNQKKKSLLVQKFFAIGKQMFFKQVDKLQSTMTPTVLQQEKHFHLHKQKPMY